MDRHHEFTGRLARFDEPDADSTVAPEAEESNQETEMINSIKQAVYDILAASEVNAKMNIDKPVYYPAILNTPAEAQAKWGLRQEEILSAITVKLNEQSLVVDATDAIDLLNNRTNNLVGNILVQEVANGKSLDTQTARLKSDIIEFFKTHHQEIAGDREIKIYV